MLKFICVAALAVCSCTLTAQMTDQKVKELIAEKDSLFWVAYNTCDTAAMAMAFASDVEFYHDMGGLSQGRDTVMGITKRNLCAAGGNRLRRVAVPGTVVIYPLKKDGVAYGALITGAHRFYIVPPGKKEFLDGEANFTQLWILSNGNWQMSRVLSYNHHPALQNSDLKEIQVPARVLTRLTGSYKSPHFTMVVGKENGRLKLTVDKDVFVLKAASDKLFFLTDRDLTFTFEKDKLIVREHGEVVEEGVKL